MFKFNVFRRKKLVNPNPTQGRLIWERFCKNKVSMCAFVVLVLIVLKSGRRGRAGRMRGGCGCAPLGWLFSLLGLNVLIDTFRRRS